MIQIKQYVKVNSLDEAYELNQKKSNIQEEIDLICEFILGNKSFNEIEKAIDKFTNSAISTLGRKIGNSIFKKLFKNIITTYSIYIPYKQMLLYIIILFANLFCFPKNVFICSLV